MTRRHAIPAALATLPATLALALPLSAPAAQPVIEEVVVTARKREESLQEVPIAVTAFTEDTIRNAGIERPQDFINLTSNVFMADTANVGDTQVSIRGINSTRDAESTFAYVVDGVLLTNPNSFNRELVDVAQIEVLKGPQGALYGRNAVAGAILVTTRLPEDAPEFSFTAGAGNNNMYRGRASIAGPISETMRGRLSASWRTTDGFFENDFTGDDDSVDYFEDFNYHGRLVWDASDRLTMDFRANYSDVEAGAINFNAAFALPDLAGAFGVPQLAEDVNDHRFNYVFNTPGQNNQTAMDFSVKTDYAADWGDVTFIVAYNNLDEDLLSDGTSAAFGGYTFPFGTDTRAVDACTASSTQEAADSLEPPFFLVPGDPQNAFTLLPPYSPTTCDGYQYQERNQDDISLELRFTSDDSGRLRWIAGGYLAHLEREVVVAYGADLGLGYETQPLVGPTGLNPTDLLFHDDFTTDIVSAFGQVEFDLNDTMELSFALRYDLEMREVDNNVPNLTAPLLFGGGQPINPAYNDPLIAAAGEIPDRDKDFSHLQPKVSWNWMARENVNVYASYGVGFRSGGFNSLGTEDLIQQNFNVAPVSAGLRVPDQYDKEVSRSYEIGAKSTWWDRRITANAAAFYTDVQDSQFFEFFAGPFGILRAMTTIDEVEIMGVELDTQALVTENLTVYGSFGYIDSEIERNLNRPSTEGNDVPWAPEMTVNLGAEWSQPVAGMELVARLDWQYIGDTWFHTMQDNSAVTLFEGVFPTLGTADYSQTKRDGYDLANARVSLVGENWTVAAWARNLFDEDYLEEVIVAPEFGGSFIHQGAQRAWGVDLTWNF